MSPPEHRAPCPHAACPGCPLRGKPYAEELAAKRAAVVDALGAHLDGTLPPVARPVPSPLLDGYRCGAKLVFGRKGPRVVLGLFRRGTHRVVDTPACAVHHPLVNRCAGILRRLLSRAPALVSPGPGGGGWLRYAAVQVSTWKDSALVALVTRTPEGRGMLASLAARLVEAEPRIGGVVWNVNPSSGNEIFGETWSVLRGEPHLWERFGPVAVRASAGAFLQANRKQACEAYRMAVEYLDPAPGESALDVYCGVGALSLHLALRAGSVVGVEENPRAVADARAGAEAASAGEARFLAGRAEEAVPRLADDGFRPAVVGLNPARQGAHIRVLEAIRTMAPRAIAYLSCNPETLARDLAHLCRSGRFAVERVVPLDFFPGTEHVEALALIRRR